jgi:hypothetical protein
MKYPAGFSSFVGFDREEGVAVVVLGNARRLVDGPAFHLLCTLKTDKGCRPIRG